jgi:hypothetical protein
VGFAADAGAARRVADAAGLTLRHVERVGGRVAWSAVRPYGDPAAAPDDRPDAHGSLDA